MWVFSYLYYYLGYSVDEKIKVNIIKNYNKFEDSFLIELKEKIKNRYCDICDNESKPVI